MNAPNAEVLVRLISTTYQTAPVTMKNSYAFAVSMSSRSGGMQQPKFGTIIYKTAHGSDGVSTGAAEATDE